MPPSRDSLFPSTSISRAGSSQLHRVASHESLNAHPLLSSNSPPASTSGHATTSSPEALAGNGPRYVPYTPRHRPPASPATTGMTTHSPIPVASHQQQIGGATSRLQLQNLKAAAQGIGLGNGTVGWVILEKLVDGETGPEWDDIWTAITTAKPTFLLPLEPFSGEIITPELVRDHIALCGGPPPSPLVTLSGLRGFVNDGTLTVQSTLPCTSQSFCDLLKPDLQSAALISLPPLPSPLMLNSADSFPSFALPGSTVLPLPPRFHTSKPPLPPRPSVSSTSSKASSAPRISNPFASLFGRPPLTATANNLTASPATSQISLSSDDAQGSPHAGVEVAAFSVGKKITKKSIGKELSRTIKEDIKGGLVDCPAWVVDRVIDYTGPLHPIPKSSKRLDIRRTSSTSDPTSRQRTRAPSILPPSTHSPSDPSVLADAFQTFYASIEDDLRVGYTGNQLLSRRKEGNRIVSQTQEDSNAQEIDKPTGGKPNDRKAKEEKDSEAKIREILERVESVVCSVFYDRTFRPLSGDDSSHDDALANRIAALNMLDLGLEHLGVEIPNEVIKSDVYAIVKSCGETLQLLDDSEHRSPAQKSALLVDAHKRIVDGLSRLPQLRLKPEREFEEHDQKTPKASTFGKQSAQDALCETSATSTMSDQAVATSIGAIEHESTSSTNDIASTTTISSLQSMDPLPIPLSDSDTTETIINAQGSHEHPSDISGHNPSPHSRASTPLHARPGSPTQISRSPTTVSGDLLFPLLIFSVVKANPAHLVSHLLYTQRFRSTRVGGQESYCLINLMAVVEFLEHVDMGALGLGDSERVMSTADLTPIPLAHGAIDSADASSPAFSTRLGKRVNQQVGELAGLAGSAGKVVTGVVDSSFGVLRGFLTSTPDLSTPHSESQDSAPWNAVRPGFGLLRRGSGFSIASVAASLPGRPKTPAGDAGEEGQQLIEVTSRPGSIKEEALEEEDDDDEDTSSLDSDEDSPEVDTVDRGDSRSVRSFSSMMSRESRDRDRTDGRERMSLTDRLANMSVRSKISASPAEQHITKASPPSSRPTSRPSSWLPPTTTYLDAPSPSNAITSPPKIRIPPPNRRFLECTEHDIRVGEVGELLREYRRMVEALRTAGAFEDQ